MAEENEKKDSSAVGKINNAISKGRDIRRAYKIARTGRTMAMAAEGAGALLSNPAGIAIIAIVLVSVVTLFALFGGAPVAVGGDLTNSPSPSEESASPSATVNPGNIAQYVKISGGTLSQQTLVYKVFSIVFSYPKYKSLITAGGGTLTIVLLSDASGQCHGFTPSGTTIKIWNFSICEGYPFGNSEYLLVHESGHAISSKNSRVWQDFVANAWKSDPGCYENGFLKTYALRTTVANKESFAEAIADYIACGSAGVCNYGGPPSGKPISNFIPSCPNTSNWVKNIIF